MTRIGFIMTLLVLHVTAPAVGRAQPDSRLTPGARVRVQWVETPTRQRRASGTLLEFRADSLAFEEGAGVRRLALARVARIDVRVPRSRGRAAARGAWLGTVIGFGVGLVAGGIGAATCEGSEYCGLWLVSGPLVGAMAGLPLGTLTGATNPGQRWQRVGFRGGTGR
jgi:hypothetical protein